MFGLEPCARHGRPAPTSGCMGTCTPATSSLSRGGSAPWSTLAISAPATRPRISFAPGCSCPGRLAPPLGSGGSGRRDLGAGKRLGVVPGPGLHGPLRRQPGIDSDGRTGDCRDPLGRRRSHQLGGVRLSAGIGPPLLFLVVARLCGADGVALRQDRYVSFSASTNFDTA